MNKESLGIGVAGVLFGLLVGRIIGSQQAPPAPSPASAAATPEQPATGQAAGQQTPAPLDESRAAALATTAQKNPNDEATRVQLANMYFDAERFQDAVDWYQQALAINEQLADKPELVNEDPYGEGWIIRVRLDDPDSVSSSGRQLMDAAAYRSLIEAG